ncbi:MAG: Transposase domain [Sphingobacteriales bacterium]|nr:Transposase domain [Sphingobacteriales bacterium]
MSNLGTLSARIYFETPFSQKLHKNNRWVLLGDKIPWDEICNVYSRQVGLSPTGRPPISPRIVIGSLIIKHMCNLDDREAVAQISENMYMQYFLGYSSFSPDPPFDASLFVGFRNQMGMEQINALNEKIHHLHQQLSSPPSRIFLIKKARTSLIPGRVRKMAVPRHQRIPHRLLQIKAGYCSMQRPAHKTLLIPPIWAC